jgi:hypothetical protein
MCELLVTLHSMSILGSHFSCGVPLLAIRRTLFSFLFLNIVEFEVCEVLFG